MYQPKDCNTLENVDRQQIRLLLQSVYGQGKTFAAMTAPNPVVLNLDNNLGAHVGRKDIINVPFYDKSFVKKWNNDGKVIFAIERWLKDEGSKLQADQTLVEDGLTNLLNHYDKETPCPLSTKTGKEDWMTWWGEKLDWQKNFFESLKSLKCDVIITCHEQVERNDDGEITNKILPLVQGSFKDQIGTHFTDIFRQHAVTKMSDSDIEKNKDKILLNYNFETTQMFNTFQDSFDTNTMYLWQRQPDSVTACKCHIKGASKFCRADWKTFSV